MENSKLTKLDVYFSLDSEKIMKSRGNTKMGSLLFVFTTFAIYVTLMSQSIIFPIERFDPEHRYITSDYTGRTGNHMFNYASLLGISLRNNLTAILPDSSLISDYFQLGMKMVDPSYIRNYMIPLKQFKEDKSCAFDIRTDNFESPYCYYLSGYYQSWKYFKGFEHEVRKHFQIKPTYLKEASHFMNKSIPKSLQRDGVVKIAVHVRRGDMMSFFMKRFGYTEADAKYFTKAMTYFQKKYPKCAFIVCTDDLKWTKDNIKGDNVIYSDQTDPIVDLAIMSMCDHTIMSVGSFGWWAAWLVNGTTIYYKDWPTPSSSLERLVIKKEYFPPHWIPMS